jgi:hypothetical protein
MKRCSRLSVTVVVLCGLLAAGRAQETAFSYQGRLYDGGAPASGIYDFQFSVYDALTNGTPVGGTLTNLAVPVSNGLFSATLDFGVGVFTGPDRWLQIAVRTNGAVTFTNLSPRQKILSAPYAVFANTASNLSGTLPAAQLSGTLPASAFAGYTNTVALTNGANQFAGTFVGAFAGNGAGVTNVNVANLTGVLVPAQLPPNTAYVNSNQTFLGSNNFTGPLNVSGTNFFHGPNTFTNWGNSFVGSFFGNGLVGWVATNGTAVQAQIDHGYLLTAAQVATLTLPAVPNAPGDIVRVSGGGAGGWRVAQNSGQTIIGNFLGFGNVTWLPANAPAGAWQTIAASADGVKMAAAIGGGGIYVSQDSGKTWSGTSAGSGQWHSIASSADGSKLIAANGLGIYASTNSGSTWMLLTGGNAPQANLVASSADGTKLVAAVSGGGIYTSVNSGANWTSRIGNAAWSALASSADGQTLVAVVNGGPIYTSGNGGTNWTARDSSRAWSAVAESADGTRMIAAVAGGGLYVSTDSGATWNLQTGAPTSASWSCVAISADGGRMAAGIANGSIYISVNAGATWTAQNVANEPWTGLAMSAGGTGLAATFGGSNGGIDYATASAQSVTTPGVAGGLTGAQGTAVELQYLGGGEWMPVSVVGTIWAY